MRIFINYRHSDTAWVADMLREKLAERYGRDRVFLDSHEIPPGDEYPIVLWRSLVECTVLLVVIGPQWLTVRAEAAAGAGLGPRRIDQPDDDLRNEIDWALRLGKKIVPVLIDGVLMPTAEELPGPLKRLTEREYVRLNAGTAHYEIRRLLDELDRLFADGSTAPTDSRAPADAASQPSGPPPAWGPSFAHGGIFNAGPTTVHGDQVAGDRYASS